MINLVNHIGHSPKVLCYTKLKLLESTPDYEVIHVTSLQDTENILHEQLVDLVIIELDHKNMDFIHKLGTIAPFIVLHNKTNTDLALQALEMGALRRFALPVDTTVLSQIVAKKIKIKTNFQYKNNPQIISKSENMIKTIKTMRSLKSAHVISLFGKPGCGKKFLASYFAQLWQKNICLIDSSSTHILKTFNLLDKILEKNEPTMFIINHPEQLNPTLQMRILTIMNRTIGNATSQWIYVINEGDERNLISLLLERISIFTVHVPTLEERKEDVPDIAKIMQKNLTKTLNRKTHKIDMNAILQKNWPANFKQLKAYLEQMLFIDNNIEDFETADMLIDNAFLELNLKDATKLFEKVYLQRKIAESNGQLQTASKLAEINRTTLYRKLRMDG